MAQGIATFNPSEVKLIVFDVDETLVHDTTKAKDVVWENELFPKEIEKIKQVNRMFDKLEPFPDGSFHQGDRYARIAYMLGCWNSEDETYRSNSEVCRLAEQFEELVQEKVQACSVEEVDIQALRTLSMSHLLFVASNVPHKVLKNNLTAYGILSFFKAVYGTPLHKVGALRKVIQTHKLRPKQVLMVGDGNPDRDAAAEVGTQFVGLVKEEDKWPEETFPKIKAVAELLTLLRV